LQQLSEGLQICEDNQRKGMERLRVAQFNTRLSGDARKPTVQCPGCKTPTISGSTGCRCVQCGRYVHEACLRDLVEEKRGLGPKNACRTADCERYRDTLYKALLSGQQVTRLCVDLLTC